MSGASPEKIYQVVDASRQVATQQALGEKPSTEALDQAKLAAATDGIDVGQIRRLVEIGRSIVDRQRSNTTSN